MGEPEINIDLTEFGYEPPNPVYFAPLYGKDPHQLQHDEVESLKQIIKDKMKKKSKWAICFSIIFSCVFTLMYIGGIIQSFYTYIVVNANRDDIQILQEQMSEDTAMISRLEEQVAELVFANQPLHID
jgi:cell division protein FtsL